MLLEIAVSLVVILGSLYWYLTRDYNYWEKKGVPYVRPVFPLGSGGADQVLGRTDLGTTIRKWYTEYRAKGLKYFGTFEGVSPVLHLIDLDLCKHILTKDFNHFVTRGFSPQTHQFMTKHLFALEGQDWKDMRTKLTPTFTSGKMKNMYVFMEKCAKQLQDHIEHELLAKGEFDVKDLTARFTTDIIATCAFGLEVNSITDRENEFYHTGLLIFKPSCSQILKFIMHKCLPTTSKLLRLNIIDPKISCLLTKIVKETIEYRKQNNVVRNDFIDLLVKVKENKLVEDETSEVLNGGTNGKQHSSKTHTGGPKKDQLTLEQMAAQAFVFFAAGYETASSTTRFALYELAMNPTVQEKLRVQIDDVLARHKGEITYQALQEMPYMDQVMNETLRRYTSLPLLTRVCTERYQLPGSDLVIDKGLRVNLPIFAIHHDPQIYPDPFRFDPERFSEQNSRDRHHYAFMPFGEGPRNCIGKRFGQLQVKISLASILSKFQISPAEDTPKWLEIDPHSLVTASKHPFSLRISRRADL